MKTRHKNKSSVSIFILSSLSSVFFFSCKPQQSGNLKSFRSSGSKSILLVDEFVMPNAANLQSNVSLQDAGKVRNICFLKMDGHTKLNPDLPSNKSRLMHIFLGGYDRTNFKYDSPDQPLLTRSAISLSDIYNVLQSSGISTDPDAQKSAMGIQKLIAGFAGASAGAAGGVALTDTSFAVGRRRTRTSAVLSEQTLTSILREASMAQVDPTKPVTVGDYIKYEQEFLDIYKKDADILKKATEAAKAAERTDGRPLRDLVGVEVGNYGAFNYKSALVEIEKIEKEIVSSAKILKAAELIASNHSSEFVLTGKETAQIYKELSVEMPKEATQVAKALPAELKTVAQEKSLLSKCNKSAPRILGCLAVGAFGVVGGTTLWNSLNSDPKNSATNLTGNQTPEVTPEDVQLMNAAIQESGGISNQATFDKIQAGLQAAGEQTGGRLCESTYDELSAKYNTL